MPHGDPPDHLQEVYQIPMSYSLSPIPLPIKSQEFSKKKLSDSAWKRFRKIARLYTKEGGTNEILAEELNSFSYNITPRQAKRLVDNYRRRDVGQYRLVRNHDSHTKGPAYYRAKRLAQALQTLETLQTTENISSIETENNETNTVLL